MVMYVAPCADHWISIRPAAENGRHEPSLGEAVSPRKRNNKKRSQHLTRRVTDHDFAVESCWQEKAWNPVL
jgi:hypothetical protein